MKYDQYGKSYVDTVELCDILYKNPDIDLSRFEVIDPDTYNRSVTHLYANLPKLKKYKPVDYTNIEEFDAANQANWHMPEKYKTMDIAEWVLAQCTSQEELQRVGQELLLFQDRDLFDLLRFTKYLVDVMREHKIVCGVGRGSSVASFVLYKIGIHKINSLYYDLDIAEFLK